MKSRNILKTISKKNLNLIDNNLRINGYAHIKNLFNTKYLHKIKKIVEDLYNKNSKQKYKGLPDRDSKDLRVYNLPKRHKIFCDIISEKTLENILK